MSANLNETASGQPAKSSESDEADRAFIEQRRRRRVQKKQFIARARRVVLGGRSSDHA